MSFNSETARLAGKKSKRGPAKVLPPTIKEKLKILYEDTLDYLIINQNELSPSERIKLLTHISNYILPKAKPVRDEFTLIDLQIEKENFFSNKVDPRE